jgi:hypothetical protein
MRLIIGCSSCFVASDRAFGFFALGQDLLKLLTLKHAFVGDLIRINVLLGDKNIFLLADE